MNVSLVSKEAKSKYYREYVESNKENPCKIAKLFDELSGKAKDNKVTSLTYSEKTLTNNKDIANAFNTHFINIPNKYIPDQPEQCLPDLTRLEEYVAARVPPNNFFKIPLMTEVHVENFIKKLDSTKATGLDDIGAKYLKLAGPYITKTLTQICNLSISSNTFPSSWKIARVTPLHKKNNKDDPNNYRPISILPILSKLLEKHVANHLYEFLTCHDLIATRQSGFRPKHSCETALHLMVDEWVEHMFKSEVVGVLYIDFCKAFDLVDHDILLEKMKRYNFSNDSLSWFSSYFSDRKQCVKINKTMSDQLPINTGVPQGSIMGPLSFLLGVNDLPLEDSLEELALFADDATDSAHDTDVKVVEQQLRTKTNNVNKWCKANRMVLGIEKTKGMLMGSKQKLRTIPNAEGCLNLEVEGKAIEQVSSERLLGVQIDNSLSWNDQTKKVRKTALFKISILRKIKKYLPQDTRKLFFNYYIKPHLTYCSSIWGQTSKENLNTINKLQKQTARLILDKDYFTPSDQMFRELGWLTFADCVQYQQALLVYKTLNNLAPPYMKNMFQYVQDIGKTNLRSVSDKKLFIPRAHPKSIRSSGPKIWNSLKNETRTAKTLKQFKRQYQKSKLTA